LATSSASAATSDTNCCAASDTRRTLGKRTGKKKRRARERERAGNDACVRQGFAGGGNEEMGKREGCEGGCAQALVWRGEAAAEEVVLRQAVRDLQGNGTNVAAQKRAQVARQKRSLRACARCSGGTRACGGGCARAARAARRVRARVQRAPLAQHPQRSARNTATRNPQPRFSRATLALRAPPRGCAPPAAGAPLPLARSRPSSRKTPQTRRQPRQARPAAAEAA
jgi:hypothetical protein